jgi:hypothetical protein
MLTTLMFNCTVRARWRSGTAHILRQGAWRDLTPRTGHMPPELRLTAVPAGPTCHAGKLSLLN